MTNSLAGRAIGHTRTFSGPYNFLQTSESVPDEDFLLKGTYLVALNGMVSDYLCGP